MSALLSLCASLLVNSWFEFNKIYWFYLTHREVCLLVFFYILFSCFFFFGLIFYVIFSPNPHASPFSPMINWICNRSIFFWRLRKHRRDRELFLLRLGGVLETLISLVLYVSLIAYNHIGSINNIGHPVCGSSFRFVIYSLILGL
jgi:hypothetical protein